MLQFISSGSNRQAVGILLVRLWSKYQPWGLPDRRSDNSLDEVIGNSGMSLNKCLGDFFFIYLFIFMEEGEMPNGMHPG